MQNWRPHLIYTILIFVLTMGWFIMFLIMAAICLVAFSLDVLEHGEEDRSSCVAAPPAPSQLCDSRCVCKPSGYGSRLLEGSLIRSLAVF